MVSFPPVSSPRPYTPLDPHPYEPHAQPISFFSILSPAQYWVRSRNYLVPRYAISSIPPVTSSLLGPNIFLNTLFSNTLSFLSSRSVNDPVSHPYKTRGKIIFLYILIFKFLDSYLEDKRFCTEWWQPLFSFPLLMRKTERWQHSTATGDLQTDRVRAVSATHLPRVRAANRKWYNIGHINYGHYRTLLFRLDI